MAKPLAPVLDAASIDVREEFGWKHTRAAGIELWTKGYGRVADPKRLARDLGALGVIGSGRRLSQFLLGLDGHFAIVARGRDWALAAVDRVRSIPLAFAESRDGAIIDDQAECLRGRLGLDDIDDDAALALAMAGYTIDTATLYRGIEQLGPGEFVLFRNGEAARRERYYTYRPWRADKPSHDAGKAGKALAETTLAIIDKMMKGIGDRQLVVPLSAGRDSRLIVSAARHLGYDNVLTFAYGRKGNHEAAASRAIAERLGYPWRFVATDTAFMRRHYASEDWRLYNRFADTLQSVPFVQDLPQIQALKREGYISGDAVLCNGNSGDFISGAHIVPPMDEVPGSGTKRDRIERIAKALYTKHFSLWSALRSDANEERIRALLRASIARAGARPEAPENDYGIYEYAEFQDRQCKFVITGQRIYEYLGHEWRLPLWDNAYLDFFEAVPLEGKRGQALYARMLEEENWGGVWHDVPVNRKTIRPAWIRPLRFLAKAAHAPLGRDSWHRFERRYFQYWMESGCHSSISPYLQVARSRDGARHGISWLTRAYLGRHGLGFDGAVAGNA